MSLDPIRAWWRASDTDRGGREDAGFTLIELMIASMLTAVVTLSVLGVLISQQQADRQLSIFADNQEKVRETLVALQRDLRSAEPLTGSVPAGELRYRVELYVYESVRAIGAVRVRWRLDTATRELVRETLAADGTVTGTSHRLSGVANATSSRPIFTYYKADGIAYDLANPTTLAGTVAICTTRVGIDLRAAPGGGIASHLSSDVQLRNRLPGEDVCPV